jgi:hypothetical protein
MSGEHGSKDHPHPKSSENWSDRTWLQNTSYSMSKMTSLYVAFTILIGNCCVQMLCSLNDHVCICCRYHRLLMVPSRKIWPISTYLPICYQAHPKEGIYNSTKWIFVFIFIWIKACCQNKIYNILANCKPYSTLCRMEWCLHDYVSIS